MVKKYCSDTESVNRSVPKDVCITRRNRKPKPNVLKNEEVTQKGIKTDDSKMGRKLPN